MFDKIFPYLLSGISVGGQYALIAVGYTMVYGILRLINFAKFLRYQSSFPSLVGVAVFAFVAAMFLISFSENHIPFCTSP